MRQGHLPEECGVARLFPVYMKVPGTCDIRMVSRESGPETLVFIRKGTVQTAIESNWNVTYGPYMPQPLIIEILNII